MKQLKAISISLIYFLIITITLGQQITGERKENELPRGRAPKYQKSNIS